MALINATFFSESLLMQSSITAIIPQNPHGKTGKYKTLYLLHGLSDDHTIWHRRTSIERYVDSLGIAVIMPNVHRSFYVDMAQGLKYWTFLNEELPNVVQSLFPISDKREDTFVAGLSMGGYGAFKWALSRPDQIAAAASLSGALGMAERVIVEDLDRRAEFERTFGTNPKGSENDLFEQVQKLAASEAPKPMLYQWCGTEDFLYEENVAFRELCQTLDLPYTYEEGPGDHQWKYWDLMIQRVLEWLPLK